MARRRKRFTLSDKETPLSEDEQRRLISIVHQDSSGSAALAARDKLVETNLGLVRLISYEFIKHSPGHEADDLVQEGSLALLDAIRYYNPRQGTKFTTYAGDCVRRRIGKYLDTLKNRPFPQEPDDPETNPIEQELQPEPSELVAMVRAAVGQLHPMARAIVEGRNGMGGPVVQWGDLASQLGIPLKTVREIYEKALRTLKRHVTEPSE